MTPLLALFVALQQHPVQNHAWTTPPRSDTLGYWQQRADYRIVATLDEARGVVRGVADLVYVNHSPDTLREFYVHQHLNAFRPASAWSRADEREGRVRFQHLADPDYAYERFTTAPTFDGAAVPARYPGAPDSTVAHFTLPRRLPPGDSMRVHFEWDARPSTLPRRQGRGGRSFDFAQWYPRVAVYDRGGWQPNPLVPAGEFYGEFGDFDVTLVLPQDQVIGATGVPVEGDPGWQRALRWGRVHPTARAYERVPDGPPAAVPAGFKRVRFLANDVHHFAWSTSPAYRYEGGAYVRANPASAHFPVWDTVAVHVLYQPADTATWGNGIAVNRTIVALRWLEQVFGPYGYPQMTNLHRIEGGGTEFPMMMMNGSASQGLILHEGGHIFAHGILGNNEWRSGWLDEGLTSYQSAWFANATPQDRATRDTSATAAGRSVGYAGRAVRLDPEFGSALTQQLFVHTGRAEPLGTRANEFNEFAIYNLSVYSRAEIMYGALREVLGDSAFRAFLHDYYARWAFKHVDEHAMRGSAQRVTSGLPFEWFFEQWVHRAGNLDYALTSVRSDLHPDSVWRTFAVIEKKDEYYHPMPVGVRTRSGWTIVRSDMTHAGIDTLPILTPEEPLEVRIDPHRTTYDWDRRNDVLRGPFGTAGRRQIVFDWPFLDQAATDRQLIAWMPWAMYSTPGGYALGARVRSNYQGWIDRAEAGFATSIGVADDDGPAAEPGAWRNLWFTLENPTLFSKVLDGVRIAAWNVDDAVRFDLSKTWDTRRFLVSPPSSRTLGITAIKTSGVTYLDRAQWDDANTYELFLREERSRPWLSATARLRATASVGWEASDQEQGYFRGEIEGKWRRLMGGGRWAVGARGFFGAVSEHAPFQRQLRLSADDPVSTFGNHFLRSEGSPLARPGTRYTPLGGGGLRGYDPRAGTSSLATFNLEGSRRIVATDSTPDALGLWLNGFADFGYVRAFNLSPNAIGDAGVGLAVRGMVFDRPIALRFDVPLYLSREQLGIRAGAGDEPFMFRWTFSFRDLW